MKKLREPRRNKDVIEPIYNRSPREAEERKKKRKKSWKKIVFFQRDEIYLIV